MGKMNFENTTYLSTKMLSTHLPGSGDSGNVTTQHGSDPALMAFRLIVCILGVVGNAVVIFVIVVLREHKKAITHWYVLQLAIADSMFLLTLPLKVVEDAHGEWIYSGGMCKAKETILFLNYYSSILFLTTMSVDRYIAVCHPLSSRMQRLRTNFSAYIITAILWTFALCLCAPVIAYSDKSGIDPSCKCQYEFPKYATTEEKCKDEGFSKGDALKLCLARPVARCEKNTMIEGYLLANGSWGGGDYAYDSTFKPRPSGGSVLANESWDGGDYPPDSSIKPGMIGEEANESWSGDDYYGYESGSGLQGVDSVFATVYEMGCSYARNSAGWHAYLLFNFIVMFVIPFLVMSTCYLLIALKLLRQSQRRRSTIIREGTSISSATAYGKSERKRSKSAASARAERNRIRVTCVCLVLVVLFLVCWLPFHTVHLAKMNGIVGTTQFCHRLSAVASLVAYLNSALNPYLYNFVGTKFLVRLRSAVGSVRTTVRKRASSLSSSGGTVRYKPPRKHSGGTSSNSGTVFTKIHKGKSDIESSQTASNYDEDNHRGSNAP